ncbi:MAG TPA: AMP-binding protein [Acidimicrobiales bacterium]
MAGSDLLIGDIFTNAVRAVPGRTAAALGAVPLFAALANVGAVFVPVNSLLGPDEAGAILDTCRPDLVGTDAARETLADGRIPITLDELGDRADGRLPKPVDPGGPSGRVAHVAFFTSGSTGRPKGAALSHRANYLRSHPGAVLEPREC